MYNIILIEDDQGLSDNIEYFLHKESFNVFKFSSAKQFLQEIDNIKVDLIICDVMMPDVDGFELLSELKNSNKNINVPFIYLTALTDMKALRKGMNLGATDFLTKPFQKDELINVINLRIQEFGKRNEESTKPLNIDDFLLIHVGKSFKNIQIKDIVCILSEGAYTKVNLTNDKKVITNKLLKHWETILPQNHFIRIHKSTIVNLKYVSKLEKWFNNSFVVTMDNYQDKLPISRRHLSKIRGKLIK